MAKEKQLLIEVRDKIATLKSKNFNLVGGNNDYDVVFDFDEDWQDLNAKTAIFVFDNENPVYVPFEGNVCAGVAINDATMCLIGVFSGDLRTTTPAVVDCVYRSILDEANGTPAPPKEDVYNQIIELINGIGEINAYTKEESDAKFAPLVDGKVPAENLPSIDNNAYDFVITSQEQFLSERVNFNGKRVLFKDTRFTLQEMDFNNAEYIAFCNVAVGSTSFEVRIRNFKFGNFAGFKRGWSDSNNTYYCDTLYVENFAFVENLIPPIDSVHGSGDNIIYSNGLGIMNCAITSATNCCNIVNCHLIGRRTIYFTNCTSISNLHAKSLRNDVVFENCTHLSNIALLESGSTFVITYTNCSDVDPDTCDGYEGSGSMLPDVSTSDNGKILQVVDGSWQPVYTDLPDASELNKGQFLMSNGSSYTTEEVRQLPRISETSDSGKVLIVDDATRKAAWVKPPWAEKSYVDSLVGDISTALDELHAYAQSLVRGGIA